MSEGVYIYGAGGHARKVFHTLRACGTSILGVVHGGDQRPKIDFADVPLFHAASFEAQAKVSSLFVAIGEPVARRRVAEAFASKGWLLPAVVHPRAWVAADASLGRGVYVGAGAVIETLAVIEEGCIVDIGALVDHEARVGAYVHVRPGEVCLPRSVR